ncbi:MAG TPA: alginate export family protein [Sphingobium sp.]|uniref:alginate export family protein n=1 Tax=Sphingobium sp. TaxID=1912891 RepID=UPI002ED0E6DE
MTGKTGVRKIVAWLMAMTPLALPMTAQAEDGDRPTLQKAIGNPDNFMLTGSTRLRYEALDGQPRPGFGESEDLWSLRTILSAEYRTGNVRLGAEMYDSRAFGINNPTVVSTNEVNTFELVQAYVGAAFPNAFGQGSKASVQAGRMTLNIGSRRLIAADDYRNTTNGYTGLRGDMTLRGGATATVLYVLPQTRLPEDLPSLRRGKVQMDRENFDTQLWAAFLAKPRLIGKTMGEVAYVGFAEKDAPGRLTRDRRLSSVSARLISDPKAGEPDFEVEGIYQFGTISSSTAANAPTLDVAAWFLHADLGYTFPGSAKAHLSVEYDRASGDGPGGKYGRFDTIYGFRRGEFAPSGIYAAIGRANINAPGIRFEAAPNTRVDGFVAWHPMWLASRYDSFSTTNVKDATGRSGNFAGHNIDGRIRWWLIPRLLRTELNASYLAKGRFLRDAPNAPDTGNTRYISLAMMLNY